MSFHGLHLPRPTNPSHLPPLPSSSSSSSPLAPRQPQPPPSHQQQPMRAPPPSFAHQRQQARQLKQDRMKGKSPFVPRKSTTARGKERDLSLLSVEQLAEMLERNARLLDSPDTLASLPGGGTRLQSQQERIQSRLKELEDVKQIKDELAATRLSPSSSSSRRKSEGGVKVEEVEEEDVKREEEDGEGEQGEMEDVEETGAADEASSPSAKRRIAAQLLSTSPHSLPLSLSLTLQRRAVARDREAQVKKQAKMELDRQRPEKTGELLRGAVGVDSAMGEFLFHTSTDSDSEPDESTLDEWLSQGRKEAADAKGGGGGGGNGQLDEQEDADLNPLRTAYMAGWNQAVREEKGE